MQAARQAMDEGEYARVASIADQWSDLRNEELFHLARAAAVEKEKSQLLNRLDRVSSSADQGKIYARLAELAPSDALYAELAEEHRPAVEQERREQREEARLEREAKQQFSSWDGSHTNLVRHVKQEMGDPGSFEHVETRYGMTARD